MAPADHRSQSGYRGAPLARGARRFAWQALLTAGLLLGFALRLINLGGKDIWWDEAHSWWFAAMPLFEGVARGMAEWSGAVGDPFYPITLNLWMSAAGQTPFALRFLSLIFSLLSAAYLGRLAYRAYGRATAAVALLIGVTAPAWMFYAQEVRQYAVTPLLLLIISDALVEIQQRGGEHPEARRAWLRLATGEALALYTHSFLAFGMVAVNLWAGLLWLRTFRQPERRITLLWLRNWVLSQLATLAVIAPALPGYIARTGAGGSIFTQLETRYILNAVWAQWMGIPWAHDQAMLPLRWFSLGVLSLLGVGLAYTLRPGVSPRRETRTTADFVWFIAFSTGISLLYWSFTPILHPRYLLFATGPLYAVLASIITRNWQAGGLARVGAALLSTCLLGLSAFNLGNLYTGRLIGYRHYPVGEAARFARETLDAGDGLVAPDPSDFALRYYDTGEAAFFAAGLDEHTNPPEALIDFIAGKKNVGVIRFFTERSDQRGIIPFYLERYGHYSSSHAVEGYTVSIYEMDVNAEPASAPFEPIDLNGGAMRATGLSVMSGDSITIAIRWQSTTQPTQNTSAIIRLVDPVTGWELSREALPIRDTRGEPTAGWDGPGETTGYYVLPLQPGTPPIEAELTLTLVDTASGQPLDLLDTAGAPAGQTALLATVLPGEAATGWMYASEQAPIEFKPVGSGPVSGFALGWPIATPGSALRVALEWNTSATSINWERTSIRIEQGGTVIGESAGPPLDGRTPAASTSWIDLRAIPLNQDAQPGLAEVVLLHDRERLVLGSVEIQGFTRLMTPPEIEDPLDVQFGNAIRLAGYRLDAPDPLTSSDTPVLTLYWQALADGTPEDDLKVFTQILSVDGQLVAQHDSVPAYGERPVSGWLAGEYIVDAHPISFRETYSGPAVIVVGLYHGETLARLPLSNDGDAFALPVSITVLSAEQRNDQPP
ncbi:MAG: hypothetical protein IT326_02200 [Anaerolineae bacterium]|nr:hypothetical protein [Anaerolineae bacterium]